MAADLNKNKIHNIEGQVRIRARVSPDYISQLSRDAYHLFDDPESGEMVAKVFTGQIKEGEPFITREFAEKSQKLFNKYVLTGGSSMEFMPGLIKFSLGDEVTLLNNIIGEITLKDGVVVKIEKARLPEPV